MEMDDPWGSPWAEEVQIHPEKVPKPDDQSSIPTTPLRATTLALEEKIDSPWDDADDADDGGFGDWASTSAGDGRKLGFDGTLDDWEESTLTEPHSHKDQPLDALWGDTASATAKEPPKLSPSLLPKLAEVVRQPSPDLWATESEDNDEVEPPRKEVEEEILTEEKDESRASSDTVEADTEVAEPKVNTNLDNNAKEDGIPAQSPGEEVLSESMASDNVLEADGIEEVSITESSLAVAKPAEHSIIPHTEAISSRPSSSPSDHSHHEETLPDSPRTSVDEEPKRAWVTRKVSSKVQGLVEHFDSLAIPEETFESISVLQDDSLKVEDVANQDTIGNDEPDKDTPTQDDDEDEDNDFGDFGDFEEGTSDNEQFPDSPDAIINSGSTVIDQERITLPPKDLGPVSFDVDTTVLNEIYPVNSIEPSTETVFIPDRDLDNTLSSTEQRKTWYRISRYGPKRKHDTGDDENYARVTWTHSQMREDTLKIVARWMEEDRISGRVVLGGVSKGSSVFGWTDMKAGPVPIAQAFADKRGKKLTPSIPEPPEIPREWPKGLARSRSTSKGRLVSKPTETIPTSSEIPREWPKGLARSRSTSKGRSASKPRRQSSVKSLSISEGIPAPSVETPAADFGWNSTTKPASNEPKPEGKTIKALSPPRNARSSHRSASSMSSLQGTTHKTIPPVIIPKAAPIPTTQSKASHILNPIIAQLQVQEEDEDEWGEMVASPTVSVAPVMPITKQDDVKSPTFDDFLPPVLTIPQPPILQAPPLPQSQDFSSSNLFDTPILQAETQTPAQPQAASDLQSIFSPQIVPATYPVPLASSINTNTTTSADPWASADFSFFDSPAPKPSSPSTSTTLPARTPQSTLKTNTNPSKTVTFSNPTPTPPTPSTSKTTYKTKDEIAQDAIVQSVIKDLPDLSYMFRR